MAVGATNLALRDLIFQGPQRNAVLHERADVFTLIPEVIEVEHGDVRFAAVDARMTEQVLPDTDPQHGGSPTRSEIKRFRKYSRAEGAKGVSWWDWQEASNTGWLAIGDPLSAFHHKVDKGYATLTTGSAGDFVLWGQEHLRGAGKNAPLSGSFDSSTRNAVKSFQKSNGLTVNGRVDKATWIALLRYPVHRSSSRLSAASAGQVTPPTAHLPAKRYEIPPAAGRH